mmetsp:Transcript_8989/g.25075  ORF Transcript_8989/g.25075 Transcript_8989/m.25075 type:complete len:232 (-) Transcript_8989:817-1512(-)
MLARAARNVPLGVGQVRVAAIQDFRSQRAYVLCASTPENVENTCPRLEHRERGRSSRARVRVLWTRAEVTYGYRLRFSPGRADQLRGQQFRRLVVCADHRVGASVPQGVYQRTESQSRSQFGHALGSLLRNSTLDWRRTAGVCEGDAGLDGRVRGCRRRFGGKEGAGCGVAQSNAHHDALVHQRSGASRHALPAGFGGTRASCQGERRAVEPRACHTNELGWSTLRKGRAV